MVAGFSAQPALEMQHNQGGDVSQTCRAEEELSSWCLMCSWNIKSRLLLSGPAGFRSPGAFLK